MDKTPVELIKVGMGALENHISWLVSLIQKQVKLPRRWYIVVIMPVHKKGD